MYIYIHDVIVTLVKNNQLSTEPAEESSNPSNHQKGKGNYFGMKFISIIYLLNERVIQIKLGVKIVKEKCTIRGEMHGK